MMRIIQPNQPAAKPFRKGLVFAVSIMGGAVLGACGGGSNSAKTAPLATNSVAVASSGAITAFGSVYVNGVRYDVSAAQLKKNGLSVTQSALAVGEIASVQGKEDVSSGQGSAENVDVEDNVVGTIVSIGTSSLVVLGQTVNVTASTSFSKTISPAVLSTLKVGDVVEVSGMVDTTGVVAATRISLAASGEALQVIGLVAGVDATAKTFKINGLTVDYTSATLSGFTAIAPANGDSVEVRGTVFDATKVILTATAVMHAGSETSTVAAGGRAELEGLITKFTSATDFAIDGAAVTTTSTTVYKNGSVADLAMNLRVEVRGTVNASGALVADVVNIERVAAIALEASISGAPDLTAGTLNLLGITVTVDANTRFEDRSSADLQLFTLANVSAGDSILVRGYESPVGSGKVLAVRLERIMPTTAVEVRGMFTAPISPKFNVLSVLIDTTSATFGGAQEGLSLTSALFFTQAVAQIVDVRGTAVTTATGTTVMADTVRIDSEMDH